MGQGSTANVIAAVCSFFIPGLGQLVQGRIVAAAAFAAFAFVLWILALLSLGLLGFLLVIPHLWAALDAALWHPRRF